MSDDEFRVSGHRQPHKTTHSEPAVKKGYSHEVHSAALSSNSFATGKMSDDVVDNLMRPLTTKESGVRSLKGRVTRERDGGDTYLAMRGALQNKSNTAHILPRLGKMNTSPTKTPPR